MTAGTARRLAPGTDHREVVAILARAFWDDPLFGYLTDGDPLAEYRVLPRVFRAAATDFRSPYAEEYVVDLDGGPRAFAGWLGPGAFPRSPSANAVRDARAAALLVRLRNRRTAAALLREVERRHPTEDHWYLALLGTDPTAQGRGMATAAMRPILDRCDIDGVPAYTETQRPENVTWYRRSGFEVIDELRIRDAPGIWRLWRDPRPPGTDR